MGDAAARTTSKAIGYRHNRPLTADDALVQEDVELAPLGPHDLLVEVQAVSVNPVDVKVRANVPTDGLHILGFDAAGTVVATGDEVDLFTVGDEVYYAGALDRAGTNQTLHVVDERIVGHKPGTLSMSEAAALPLTAITAWESLFDHLRLDASSRGRLLIIGATGGVGLAMIQIARALLPDVEIIASASTDERGELLRSLGATHVVDHRGDLPEQVEKIAPNGVEWLFTAYSQDQVDLYAQIVAPFGHVVAIDDGPRDVSPLKGKSITWHSELMFTRSLHQTADMVVQHDLLEKVAELVDAGRITPVIERDLTPISVETLRQAHELVETGHLAGKVVLHGW